jgi:hypothetical protein
MFSKVFEGVIRDHETIRRNGEVIRYREEREEGRVMIESDDQTPRQSKERGKPENYGYDVSRRSAIEAMVFADCAV